jgi:hypothetical protein
MKKIIVTDLYYHNVIETQHGTHATIDEESQDGMIKYEGLVSMTKTNKSGTWFLFKDGITITNRTEWYLINEPVSIFIKDESVASRKKSRS